MRELFKTLRRKWRRERLDVQAKITLVLVLVIVPTFLVVTVAQNKFTQPVLEEELRQVALSSARGLAVDIATNKILQHPNASTEIDAKIQEILSAQPDIYRIDVVGRDTATGLVKLVSSSFEDDPSQPLVVPLVDSPVSDYKVDAEGVASWEINYPIEHKSRDPKIPRRQLGTVHLILSMKLMQRIVGAIWKTTGYAAGLSVVMLLLALSYFLRKTIENDRRLKQAESHNLQLAEQLHEAQRDLMNTEKLAVMGQLTASFAHEIGTPLNAIGGHLQLLKEELGEATDSRVEIIEGQLAKITGIVKSFLQSTAKPTSQTQLVDVNRLVDKTLGIVRPRIESMGVEVRRLLDHDLGPIRMVPLDLEQILLNLVNNSLDSIKSKLDARDKGKTVLEMTTERDHQNGSDWALISVYDTGEGINKLDLKKVLKPFFTTKRPGEGTGLGLTICQQLAHKYGGVLEIDSKEGAWARVTLKLPYHHNS
jgi:signal transduction histidine kinase